MSYFLNYSDITGFSVNSYRNADAIAYDDLKEMLCDIDDGVCVYCCVSVGSSDDDIKSFVRNLQGIADTSESHNLWCVCAQVEDTLFEFSQDWE